MARINPEKFLPPPPDEVAQTAGNAVADGGDMIANILRNNPISFLGEAIQRLNSDMRRRL